MLVPRPDGMFESNFAERLKGLDAGAEMATFDCFTAVDVFDEQGRPVRGKVGELVCKQPWPGMTRGFWNDRERYLESYWARLPGVWVL